MIIIIGAEHDPSVARVAKKIEKKGVGTVIIDPFTPQQYTIIQDEKGSFQFFFNHAALPRHSIIWNRKKIFEGTGFYFDLDDKRAAKVLENEWNGFYQNLLSLYEGQVVNSLVSLRNRSKLKQHILAYQAGLGIASALVSNDKKTLAAFSQQNCVIKTLSGRKIPPKQSEKDVPYNFMTLRLDRSELLASPEEEVKLAPSFLMHEINKAYELRVVVTGKKLLAFKVDSQKYDSTTTDWRFGNLSLAFSLHTLPPAVESAIFRYMKLAGLTFGSIDIVVNKQGEHIFLECNQDGIWEWLEPSCEYQISTNYADTLVELYSHSRSSY